MKLIFSTVLVKFIHLTVTIGNVFVWSLLFSVHSMPWEVIALLLFTEITSYSYEYFSVIDTVQRYGYTFKW